MIEKFDSRIHSDLCGRLPFSYYSLGIILDFSGYYFERNGEKVVVWQDALYPHDLSAIFMPENELNWERLSVFAATESDVQKIKERHIDILIQKPVGTEFFYKTESFLRPDVKIQKQIDQFEKNYNYVIHNTYEPEKIKKFYNIWWGQRERKSYTLDQEKEFFNFCINNLECYDIRQAYIETNGELIGFAWGIPHPKGGWASLHLKTNYAYKGAEGVLRREYAGLFKEFDYCTTGVGTPEKGIENHKKALGPHEMRQYYYLFTGGKTEET